MSTVNITVNGKTIKADDTKHLLANLLANDIFVPNLCNDERLEVYGGCGLCLVSIKGMRKPARACVIKPTEGMEVETDTAEIIESRNVTLGLMLSNHIGDCIAPCRRACPTHQDAQGYIGLISQGHDEDAIKLIKRDNPLPSSIGRVCPHPCEDACRRKFAEGALSICSLKRFAADADNSTYVPDKADPSGKKIAVVGAGPAGLSCAFFSAVNGHDVDVFDSMPAPGGMLRYGIPAYRLPDEVLDREISVIEKLGVKFNYNMKLGKDITVEGLRNDYDAVFIALGAWVSAGLGLENENLPHILGGIDFLRETAVGNAPDIGNKVAVVGGGNTAMDAVRTARRLGAKEVTLLYRRTKNEMPASPWEIEEAEAEGVKFMFLVSPVAVIERNGKAAGLVLQHMQLGEPDASGRRRPVAIEGAVENVEFDTVISAIGQKVNAAGLDGIALSRRGTVVADTGTFATNIDGVFAGGDMINDGPGIAITAIAHGKNAAMAIDSYLKGALNPVADPFWVEKDREANEDIGEVETVYRTAEPLRPADERVLDFNEIGSTFTRDEALKEASRCLECGCSALYTCKFLPLLRTHEPVSVLPSAKSKRVPVDISHPFIRRDNNKCILCGLCVRVCAELSDTYALGFYDRGYPTSVECAFHTPLNTSNCISCGYCTQVCPTGALADKNAYVKSPALPTDCKDIICSMCDSNCRFKEYYYGSTVVKVIAEEDRKSCSLGRYGLPIKENASLAKLTEAEQQKLLSALTGDLRYYSGDTAPDVILNKLK